ncbi:MAG: hypothetical protein OEN50_06370 [Deltaproteobacteria bacterium]|nr:hypothetical protein [Deltaproteobacteria bacterium]
MAAIVQGAFLNDEGGRIKIVGVHEGRFAAVQPFNGSKVQGGTDRRGRTLRKDKGKRIRDKEAVAVA